MTENHRISSIRASRPPVPIQVRLIRKWKPFANSTRLSYLLIDKYGDAIQAFIEQADDAQLAERVELMGCYSLELYNCIPCPGMYKVALHTAAIRIDSETPFTPVNDDGGIPASYYNFVLYETLSSRANRNRVLTDFLGMIYSIQFSEAEGNAPAIRLNLEDTSGKRVQLCLWPEIAAALDVNRLLDSSFKLIVAAASVKVTTFFGRLQLESTTATRLEIEPEIEAARTLRVMFHDRNPVEDPTDILSQKIQVEAGPSEKNRMTVGDLLQRSMNDHRDMAYTCDATLTAFRPGSSWNYGTCPICSVTMDPQEGSYVCTKHREQEPNYKYCVKGDISDGSGTVAVTIFDKPMSDILGSSCNDMVRVHGNTDPMTLPTAIEALKDQKRVYQLNNASRDFHGNLRFTVNRVFASQPNNKRQLLEPSPDAQTPQKKAMVVQSETTTQEATSSNTKTICESSNDAKVGAVITLAAVDSTPPDAAQHAASDASAKGKAPAEDVPHHQAARQLFKEIDGGSGPAQDAET